MNSLDHLSGLDFKVLRIRARLPQQDVARELGIASSTLCGWENERRSIPATQRPRLRAAIARLTSKTAVA